MKIRAPVFLLALFAWVQSSWADWTPLVTASTFSGMQGDVSTAVTSVITIVVIILGAGLIIAAMRRG